YSASRHRVSVCPVLFFFSSRRRHTRFSRDWSSDVCSSDLEVGNMNRSTREALMSLMDELINTDHGFQTLVVDSITSLDKLFCHRSEERRVGKECRTRRSAQE